MSQFVFHMGAGFDDPTEANPVQGNDGATVGAQRQNVLHSIGGQLSMLLGSTPPVEVEASFGAETCSGGSAVLARGVPLSAAYAFPAATFPDTLYPIALANAMSGLDLSEGQAEVKLVLNSLASAECEIEWCYALGEGACSAEGDGVNMALVVLHEMVHGLGFQTYVERGLGSANLGAFLVVNGSPTPDVFSHLAFDRTSQKLWVNDSQEERAASMTTPGGLAWSGSQVINAAASYLSRGIDDEGRVFFYTPTELDGSSVAHWGSEADPPLLMQRAFDQGVATAEVNLWLSYLYDLGWTNEAAPAAGAAGAAGAGGAAPTGGGENDDGGSGVFAEGPTGPNCTVRNAGLTPNGPISALVLTALGAWLWGRRREMK